MKLKWPDPNLKPINLWSLPMTTYKNDDAFDFEEVEDDETSEIESNTLDDLAGEFDWNDEKDLDRLYDLDGYGNND